MKRNLLLPFVLIFSVFILAGCEEDDGSTSISPDRIARFLNGNETIEVSEASTDVIELPVFVNYRHDGPVHIKFEIEGDTEAVEVISDPQYATIPADQRQGKILLKAIDNDDFNDPNNSVVIRIVGADSGYALPDGTSIGYEEKTIIFSDNECQPSERDDYVGEIMIEDVGFGSYTGSAETSTENCSVLLITGDLPNAGVAEPTFQFILNSDGTVQVPEQIYCTACVNSGSLDALYSASGTYDEDSNTITVDYAFNASNGGSIWTGTNIITPN